MKTNTKISVLILVSILLVSSNISAEEINTNMRAPRAELRQGMRSNIQASTTEIRKMREENKAEIKKIRSDFQVEVKTKKASSTQLVKEKRHALIQGIQDKRELFKEELKFKKEAVSSSTLAIKAKFKADLANLKDEKKKEKVENIGQNLLELNSKITARATEHLNKIEEVLIAIETRADKTTAAGATNLANIRAWIAAAEVAVAEARAAIVVQSTKTYTVAVQSDATVKTSLETTRDQLKNDINAMNAKIKIAYDATKKITALLRANPQANSTTTPVVTSTTTLNN